jgi:lipopolysaccharide transport system permease protein
MSRNRHAPSLQMGEAGADTQSGQPMLTRWPVSQSSEGVTVTTQTLANSRTETTEPLGSAPIVQWIEPPRGWLGINWRELWNYRELLYFMMWRDIKVRYKQTAMGAAWAILQPIMTMVVFTIFFGHLAGLSKKTGGIPYPIFTYAGLLPWTFFANSIGKSGNSLVTDSNLITKVYFPRLVVPFASVAVGLVDLGISLAVLLAMMVYYGTPITGQLFLVPVFLVGTVLAATGVGTLLSAFTVSYRDFRYVVPFMTQIWMYATPVMYPSSMVPKKWLWVMALNPLTGLIEGFRAALLAQPIDWPPIGISLAVCAAMFLVSASYFRSVERRFADII